jgi:hypothetical protein
MQAAEFDEQNKVFVAEGCSNLPARVFIGDDHGHPTSGNGVPVVETRWIPNEEERLSIAAGGAVVVKIMGVRPQPFIVRVVRNGLEIPG